MFGFANLGTFVDLAAAIGNFRDANDEVDAPILGVNVDPLFRRDVTVDVGLDLLIDVVKFGIVDFVDIEPPPIVRLPMLDVDVLLIADNFEIAPLSTLDVDIFSDVLSLPDSVIVFRTRFTAELIISRAILCKIKR